MKEEKFKVINFIRQLVVYIDKYMDNFPRKEIEIKTRMRNLSYDILEIAYIANNTQEKQEIYMEQIIAKIKVLDFLLNLCYDKQIINCNGISIRLLVNISIRNVLIEEGILKQI